MIKNVSFILTMPSSEKTNTTVLAILDRAIKLIRIFSAIGMLLFFIILCAFVSFLIVYPRVLITYEYRNSAIYFVLPLSIIIGLSFLVTQINFENLHYRVSRSLNKPRGRKPKKRPIISNSIVFYLFLSAFVGALVYSMLPSMSASYLHQKASKEYVQFEAVFSSAWPAGKDIRAGCQYHLLFDSPKISPNVQYVCLRDAQWPYYRDLDFSAKNTVILYGEKSYYGYELHCCK